MFGILAIFIFLQVKIMFTTGYGFEEARIYLMQMAFRSKAKQYHPDQNQENKEVAEARFKEVMTSYEAIKSERKNMK